jgi:hypothetical protein
MNKQIEQGLAERIAILLWERFSPDHRMEWDDEIHKDEYRNIAAAVLYEVEISNQFSTARDRWIKWNGNGSPAFDEYDVVSCRTRGGRETGPQLQPWTFKGWNHTGSSNDIVEYRIDNQKD